MKFIRVAYHCDKCGTIVKKSMLVPVPKAIFCDVCSIFHKTASAMRIK